MSNADVLGLVFTGWVFGVQTCLLYVSVRDWRQARRDAAIQNPGGGW